MVLLKVIKDSNTIKMKRKAGRFRLPKAATKAQLRAASRRAADMSRRIKAKKAQL
jgi:hypothetical protein